MPKRLHPMLALILGLLSASVAWSQDARTLRLVPFPKEVRLQQGEFTLNEPLTLELSKQANPVLVSLLGDELKRAGLPAPEVRIVTTDVFGLRLSHSPRGNLPKLACARRLARKIMPCRSGPMKSSVPHRPTQDSSTAFRPCGS